MKALLTLAALLLAGCATSGPYAECTVPTTRDAGMGARVPDCANWRFGPTPAQQRLYERRHGREA